MNLLDIKVFYMINTLMLIFLSFYSLFFYRKNKNNPAIKYLTFFTLFYTIGFILLILRNQIPDFLSVLFANVLFTIGSVCLYIAIRAILNLEARWKAIYWIPILIVFVGFYLFTYVYFDPNMRFFLYSLFVLVFSILDMRLFILYSSPEFKLFDKISILIYFLSTLIFLSLCIYITLEKVSGYFFSNVNIIVYLPSFYMIILNIWIVLVLSYRIRR